MGYYSQRNPLKKKSLAFMGALLLLALFVLYCRNASYPGDDGAGNDIIKSDPSFSEDIQSIFTSSCVFSGCHNTTAQAGLNLIHGQSYANLVNVDSAQDLSRKRVKPFDAPNSYLVIKIEGEQSTGQRMPLGGEALSSARIQNIKNWITTGAKNN
jgi:hypothetical protein